MKMGGWNNFLIHRDGHQSCRYLCVKSFLLHSEQNKQLLKDNMFCHGSFCFFRVLFFYFFVRGVSQLTSPQGVGIHCTFSFLGQRRRTHASWAFGLWCCLHMLSGTTTALAPGSVLRQNTLRFLRPRPQDLEHWQSTRKKQMKCLRSKCQRQEGH